MTDYAPIATSDHSWAWWMTTATTAIRQYGVRDRPGESDDEFEGSNCKKRKRVNGTDREGYWTSAAYVDDGGWQSNDLATAGPLDLSVKATLTTKTATVDGREAEMDRDVTNEYKVSTPVKKPPATTGAGRSSKKTMVSKVTGGGRSCSAVKAATRKLLPQLLLDHRHVDRSSPVSGTIIVPVTSEDRTAVKQLSPSPAKTDCNSGAADHDQEDDYDGGDIDPEFNVVVATDEARRRLDSIPNVLGPYLCRLCGVQYTDAFALARHRCRCIVHVRYSCPECDKVFQCPANLASHRRWHSTGGTAGKMPVSGNGDRAKSAAGVGAIKAEAVIPTINYEDDEKDVQYVVCTATDTAVSSTLTAITTTAGFKKNILQRAVQAAAAADVCAVQDAS